MGSVNFFQRRLLNAFPKIENTRHPKSLTVLKQTSEIEWNLKIRKASESYVNKKHKKPLIYYWCVATLIIMGINMFSCHYFLKAWCKQ